MIGSQKARRAVFTICSNNYVPYASVLLDSVRRHHPEADRFLCLVDEKHPGVAYPDACQVIEAAELGIRDFAGFAFRYNVMELNTAVKPFMFTRLLREQGYGTVLYFDPDIELFSPLPQVWEPLEHGASLVVTPHLLSPAEGPVPPDDFTIMRAGVYNLGFFGASHCAEAMDLMAWWSRRLRFDCINDQANGVFVDQKFVDLMPGFAPAAKILHDPGLNVAYWNLSQRRFAPDAPGAPRVDGVALGFFHFSGFDPRRTDQLSKHTEMFRGLSLRPALSAFLAGYANRLIDAGHGGVPAGLYAYGRFASGAPVLDEVRRMFRTEHPAWFGNPFETYEEWLQLPAPGTARGQGGSYVSNFMAWIRSQYPWLQANFDPSCPEGAAGLVYWWLHEAHKAGIDSRFVEPVAERVGRHPPLPTAARPRPDPVRADVTVIGYLRAESGVGEIGRLMLKSLAAAGLRVEAIDVSLNVLSRRQDQTADAWVVEHGTGRLQIFCINADQLPAVVELVRPRLHPVAYRVSVPFWELARFPQPWVKAFEQVDEVWAPSRFIQAALARVVANPVIRMPIALDFPQTAPSDRARYGLPENRFLFLLAFDFLSYADRKNPLGTVRAFHRAFADRPAASRPVLVIKTHNSLPGDNYCSELRAELSQDPDILLLDGTMSRDDMLGLVATVDAVVSLHRGEGLGLLVAEAMAVGTPVVATDYGATTELLSPQTGFPVDFRLIQVRAGQYPFPEGQVWAEPDEAHAAWQMREIVDRAPEAASRAARAGARLRSDYGVSHVARLQLARLSELGLL